MNVEVISTTDNKLLDRKEINASVSFDGATPNRKEIREAISTKLGLNPDFTILNSIVNEFGARKIRVLAHAYKDIKKLKEVEPEYLRKRDGIGVEKPKEEKPKEEETPKAEEKAPEKKEEKKEEKPPEKKEEPKKEEKPKEEPKKEEKKEEKPPEKKEEKKPEEKKEAPKEEKK